MDINGMVQTFLAGRDWSPETVLRAAVALSRDLNGKASVIPIIQKLLDDAEKADIGRLLGSTVITKTKAQWEECKKTLALLPIVLELVESSRREVSQREPQCLSFVWRLAEQSGFGSLLRRFFGASAAEPAAAVPEPAVVPEPRPAWLKEESGSLDCSGNPLPIPLPHAV